MQTTTEHQTLSVLESLVDEVIAMRAASERTSVILNRRRKIATLRGLLILVSLCAIVASFASTVRFCAFTYYYHEKRGQNIYAARVDSSFGYVEFSDGSGTNRYRFFGNLNR